MKKLLTMSLAAAFLAVSLAPVFAAEKPAMTKAPAAKIAKSTKTAPKMASASMKTKAACPAMKSTKTMKMAMGAKMGTKCGYKTRSAAKKMCMHKHMKMTKKTTKSAAKK